MHEQVNQGQAVTWLPLKAESQKYEAFQMLKGLPLLKDVRLVMNLPLCMPSAVLPWLMLFGVLSIQNANADTLLPMQAQDLPAGAAVLNSTADSIKLNPAAVPTTSGITVGGHFHDTHRSSAYVNNHEQLEDGFASAVWTDGRFALGFNYQSPVKQRISYQQNWPGAADILDNSLQTSYYQANFAWRPITDLTIGAGIGRVRTKGKLTWNDVGASDSHSLDYNAEGNRWSAGFIYQLSPSMRVGLAYYFPKKQHTAGNDSNSANPGNFGNSDVEIATPTTIIWSVGQRLNDNWETLGNLSYSSKSTLSYDHTDSVTKTTSRREDLLQQRQWGVAWGTNYTFNPQWKAKFAAHYHRLRAANMAYINVLVPQQSRFGVTLGGAWQPLQHVIFDLSYDYTWSRPIDLTAPALSASGTGVRLHQIRDQQLQMKASYLF